MSITARSREVLKRIAAVDSIDTREIVKQWTAALDVVDALAPILADRNHCTRCRICHGRTLDMSGTERHKEWCPIPAGVTALAAFTKATGGGE